MRNEFERLYYKCKTKERKKEKDFMHKYKPKDKSQKGLKEWTEV